MCNPKVRIDKLRNKSGHGHPEFIEGAVFRTTIPIDENMTDGVDAVTDTLTDAVNDTLKTIKENLD